MGVNGGWGQMGLQDSPPPLQVVGRDLRHQGVKWGQLWGQLWGQRGRVGSQGGHTGSWEVTGGA